MTADGRVKNNGKRLVDPNVLCMGCMKELNMPKEPCPYCGFYLPAYQQVKNSLPPYEILNGKYLVGKVIGVGGFGITYIGWDFYQSKRVCIKEYFPRGVASRGITETISHSSLTATLNVFTENTEQAKYAYQHGPQTYIKEAENLSHFYTMSGIVSVRDFSMEIIRHILLWNILKELICAGMPSNWAIDSTRCFISDVKRGDCGTQRGTQGKYYPPGY